MGAWEKAWVPDVVFEQDALDLAEKGESAYRSVYMKEPQAMGMNLAQKLIASHLVEGRMEVGTESGGFGPYRRDHRSTQPHNGVSAR
jgi:hypothetical protein